VAACQKLEIGLRAFAGGGGSFPWPSSPGQGKITLLCVLCASVVNLQSGLLRPGIFKLEQELDDTYY